jgi:predicted regulator of Ras-like GTPase activity (Roadblock/LC7/MglB family)
VDARGALDKLIEVSKHVEAATVFEEDGTPLASTLDDERAARVAELAARMLATVDELEGDTPVTQVEAATGDGSVFVVRDGDTAIAAVTPPAPVIGLVMYDLRSCLRSLATEKEPA